MTDESDDTVFTVSTPEHFKALGHPLRQRLMFLLGEPSTLKGLATRLDVGKGTVHHHLTVLMDAGLVHQVGTRTVRGGTERHYRRAATRLALPPQAPEPTAAMLAAIGTEIAASPSDPTIELRHVRLTTAQATRLREAMSALASDVESTPDAPRYGLLLAMYRESTPDI